MNEMYLAYSCSHGDFIHKIGNYSTESLAEEAIKNAEIKDKCNGIFYEYFIVKTPNPKELIEKITDYFEVLYIARKGETNE